MRMSDCHPEVKHFCKGLCRRCYTREYEKKRRASGIRGDYFDKYREANPDKCAAYVVTRRSNEDNLRRDYESKRKSDYKVKYNLEVEDVARMIQTCNDACEICRIPFDYTEGFNIDHCHRTGAVRGLLCMHCNTGLGHFRDSTFRLDSAKDYLRDNRSSSQAKDAIIAASPAVVK